MLNIGCHLSVSKGYEAIGKDALKIGATHFSFLPAIPEAAKLEKLILMI